MTSKTLYHVIWGSLRTYLLPEWRCFEELKRWVDKGGARMHLDFWQVVRAAGRPCSEMSRAYHVLREESSDLLKEVWHILQNDM